MMLRHLTRRALGCLLLIWLLGGCASALPPTAPSAQPEPELPGALLCMIDNHLAAYPQSGLAEADVVYEALAEGGITRLLAVFYRQRPELIGPIRSARYYFAEIAAAYQAPLAHAGGHSTALQRIAELQIPDVDEIYNSGTYFWRDGSRRMPHNLYTSADQLLRWAEAHRVSLTPLPSAASARPAAGAGSAIDWLSISYNRSQSYPYVVQYRWQDGRYQRLVNGQPHLDSTGVALHADTVIVLVAPTRSVVDQVLISEVALLGSGVATVFHAGRAWECEWRKATPSEHIQLVYQGQLWPLPSDGQLWVQVIGQASDLAVGQK